MSACFIALSTLLNVSTPAGYHDFASTVTATVYLREYMISGLVELTGDAYRKFGTANEKAKSQAVTVIHTTDGTRYEVDMGAKAVAALPCMDMPVRQGGGRTGPTNG